MTLQFIYWLIMLLWLLFNGWWGARAEGDGRYSAWGSGLLLFVMFFIIGLKVFGSPIKG